MTNEALVNMIQRGDNVNKSITALYENNLPFLRLCVRPYKVFYPEDDLLQEAYLGLYTAALKYDQNKDAAFLSYAEFWIRQAVQRATDNTGDLIRVSVNKRQQVFQYRRILDHYHRTGATATDTDICNLLGVSEVTLDRIRYADSIMQTPKSLDTPLTADDDSATLADMVSSPEDFTEAILDRVEVGQLRRVLENCLDDLPEHESFVIRQHYFEGRTLADIAEEMKKSPCRLTNIKKSALLHLKQYHSDKLLPYWENVCAVVLEPKSPPPEQGCTMWWRDPALMAMREADHEAWLRKMVEVEFSGPGCSANFQDIALEAVNNIIDAV